MLSNHTFLITGATGAIGQSLALTLAKQNARLILLTKTPKKAASLIHHNQALFKTEPLVFNLDFLKAKPQDIEALIDELSSYTHTLDGLFHCAGSLSPLSPIEHTSYSQWHKNNQINLTVPFLLTKHCLPLLKANKYAHIYFMQSMLTMQSAKAYFYLYQMTENNKRHFVECLNLELAQSAVRAHCLVLPAVASPFYFQAYPFESETKTCEPEELTAFWSTLMHKHIHGGLCPIMQATLPNHGALPLDD